MKKLSLKELIKIPALSKNDFIMDMYRNSDSIRLCCTDCYQGILLEEDLEVALSESNIDLLISNSELAILTQGDTYCKVKYEHAVCEDGSIDVCLNFNTLEPITYKKKYRYIKLSDGITYDFMDSFDCVEAIVEEYQRHSVSMYDLLASIEIIGLSAEDVTNIYAECMKRADGDIIVHIREEVDNELLKEHEILGMKRAAI